MSGPDLYERITEETGKRPTKKELVAVLQRIAEGAASRVAVVEGPIAAGSVQLTVSQIEKISHEKVTFLTRSAANAAGVVAKPGGSGPTVVSADGASAVAFAKAAEKAIEVTGIDGVSWIRVTATADPGEGINDIKALGAVIAMTPQLVFSIELNIDIGLAHGGANVYFDGPAIDYQKLESDLMKFAGHAGEVSGSLTITATLKDGELIKPPEGFWQQLAHNCATLDPGHIVVEAEVRTKETS